MTMTNTALLVLTTLYASLPHVLAEDLGLFYTEDGSPMVADMPYTCWSRNGQDCFLDLRTTPHYDHSFQHLPGEYIKTCNEVVWDELPGKINEHAALTSDCERLVNWTSRDDFIIGAPLNFLQDAIAIGAWTLALTWGSCGFAFTHLENGTPLGNHSGLAFGDVDVGDITASAIKHKSKGGRTWAQGSVDCDVYGRRTAVAIVKAPPHTYCAGCSFINCGN